MDGHQNRSALAKHILGAAFDYGHDHLARHARPGAETFHVFLDPQHQHIPSSFEAIQDHSGHRERARDVVLLHRPFEWHHAPAPRRFHGPREPGQIAWPTHGDFHQQPRFRDVSPRFVDSDEGSGHRRTVH